MSDQPLSPSDPSSLDPPVDKDPDWADARRGAGRTDAPEPTGGNRPPPGAEPSHQPGSDRRSEPATADGTGAGIGSDPAAPDGQTAGTAAAASALVDQTPADDPVTGYGPASAADPGEFGTAVGSDPEVAGGTPTTTDPGSRTGPAPRADDGDHLVATPAASDKVGPAIREVAAGVSTRAEERSGAGPGETSRSGGPGREEMDVSNLDARLSRSGEEESSSSPDGGGQTGLNGWTGLLTGGAAAGDESVAEPVPAAETAPEAAVGPARGAAPAPPEDDLADPDRLRAAVEAVLLVVDVPTSPTVLAQVLQRSVAEIDAVLHSLRTEYDAGGRGLDLREVADGWRLFSRDDFSGYVERFVLDGQQARLTQAALETLAVIAYRQPVTRSRISGIRGVSVDAVMRTLLTRGLVEECGADPDTGGGLYRTTRLFLEKMGLRSLDELPSLAPLLPDTSQLDDVAIST